MAHIHDRIDFTVAIFVVHADQVLLVHHRQLDKWLPLGGTANLRSITIFAGVPPPTSTHSSPRWTTP